MIEPRNSSNSGSTVPNPELVMDVREANAKYLLPAERQIQQGYKQTEVGLIPEDWKVVRVGQYLNGTPSYGINAPAVPFDSRLHTYLRITDISEAGRFDEENKASVNHPMSASYLLQSGDLVFARTGASVGKSYLYRPEDGELVYAGFLIRLQPKLEKLDSSYLWFFSQTQIYWSWIKTNSMRSGQPGINGQQYASLPIPIPPTKAEQEAIAEALSDADALIEALEQLVAKKRQLKQGAMQELLTGKRRLPGFNGEWEYRQISSFSAFVTKGSTPTTYGFDWQNDGIIFLRSECVSSKGLDLKQAMFISDEAHASLARGEVCSGDILITITGNVGRVVNLADDFGIANINQHIARIRVKDTTVSSKFVFFWLSQPSIRTYFSMITTGQAYPQISLKQVRETLISLPSRKEQTAIAQILTDMDAEIADLETKLSKARAVKQGMMQQLLTGRIRLP